jgi:predicted dehydrogenase
MNKKIWLIGCGSMAVEYAKVLKDLQVPFDVIGRGEISAISFKEKTGIEVITGGIENYLNQSPAIPSHAIVAVGIGELSAVTDQLLCYNIKNILVEKPGALTMTDIETTCALASREQANVYIAYNRRFYSSVFKAQEIIAEDGGLTSFHFEFTEWAHIIEKLPSFNKKYCFIGNSTHVVDTAFFLGGLPDEITCYTAGELSWHKPSVFTGAGRSKNGALFSYCANWHAPGRWGVELMTNKHRLYLKPMEMLQIQKIGSLEINPVETDDVLDKCYKPGLYLETQAFVTNSIDRFCSIKEQKQHFNFFEQICNCSLFFNDKCEY